MTLNLTIPQQAHTDFTPRITVIGVGGGGCNAVNNMIAMGLDGVDFLVANTDAQALSNSRAGKRVQLGPHLTQGLGAGAKPEIGRAAAEEATEELARHLEGVHMVFVTAGMGGGTGTGAAPVVARMARERGILTVGVVTKPFDFEGRKRLRLAEGGIEEMQQVVDTLIIIPNQNLFRLANERTTFQEAFKMADNVLYMGVRGVTDLMVNPGLVNLDFADIRTVMAEMGKAMMGTGEAEGEDRAVRAAESAISNPLLDDISMRGAKALLINITGGHDMTLFELDEATNRIRKEVDEDANIIFGTSLDPSLEGRVRVSVVATGIDAAARAEAAPVRLVANGGPVDAVARTEIPTMRPATAAPTLRAATTGPVVSPAPVRLGPAQPTLRQAVPVEEAPREAAEPAPEPATAYAPPPEPARPAQAPVLRGPARAPEVPAAATAPRRPSLFHRMTGLGDAMRRNLTPERPARPEPTLAPAPRETPRQPEDSGLDIPTFLRRQGN
ncbi:MAG: cell division protein FtsZ [Acetobacteraceae bacterium]